MKDLEQKKKKKSCGNLSSIQKYKIPSHHHWTSSKKNILHNQKWMGKSFHWRKLNKKKSWKLNERWMIAEQSIDCTIDTANQTLNKNWNDSSRKEGEFRVGRLGE